MEQRRLLRDGLFNMSASVLTALLGLIAVPLFVSRLPTGAYADWIVTLATARTSIIIDFGIGWTVVHLVALEGGRLSDETQAQLRTAATLLGGLSVVIAPVVFAAGALELGDLRGARLAIVGAGAIMATASHINSYTMAVLAGSRRYDLSSLIVTLEAASSSGGVITILLSGGGIMAVATWEAIVVVSACIVKLIVAARLCPTAAFRPALRWPTAPGRVIRFSIESQVSDGLADLFWNLGVLIVGQIGPAAVVTFHVAQKVPVALIGFISRAAEVTMPAASGALAAQVDARATVAISSSRIAMALSLPAVITLWFAAAPFLLVWVGQDDPDLTAMLQIAGVAVAAHAMGEGARYFLWGMELIGAIVIVQVVGTAGLILCAAALWWTDRLDALSVSLLQAGSVAIMSLAFGVLAAARTGMTTVTYARRIGRGMPMALVAAFAAASALIAVWSTPSWPFLLAIAAATAVAFYGAMFVFGLDPAEAVAVRSLLRRA